MNRNAGISVAVVIVTYGRRWHLVREVLRVVCAEPAVQRIVVVDNGAEPPVRSSLQGVEGKRVEVVELGRNIGSAGGYAAGIDAARKNSGCSHLLLLDDDNVPDSGCIDGLAHLYSVAKSSTSGEVVISALRHGRGEYERLLSGESKCQIRKNSFLGFHVADVPRKIIKRIVGGGRDHKINSSRVREITFAPYGGLFFSVELAKRCELPRGDYILYGDDHEYTLRLVKCGARLYLTDFGAIVDIDCSWNEGRGGNPWVKSGAPEWKVYYSIRNRCFVEREFVSSPLMYRTNFCVYMAYVGALAALYHRSLVRWGAALRPILDAVKDAGRGKLGENLNYPIPQAACANFQVRGGSQL